MAMMKWLRKEQKKCDIPGADEKIGVDEGQELEGYTDLGKD